MDGTRPVGGPVPVVVDLSGSLAEEVRAFVGTEAGWQEVKRGTGLQPVLAIAAEPLPDLPTVVVVDGEASGEQVRRALQDGAVDAIGWPGGRERLLLLPDILADVPATTAGATRVVFAGVAGGVGTSTVALAAGGLLAWAGARTIVVGDDGLLRLCGLGPWQGPGAREIAALGSSGAALEVAQLTRPVPGIAGLRVLGGGAVGDTGSWPADVVVVDAGRAVATADVVCARPDVHLEVATALLLPVLLNRDGPLDRAGACRLLGRAPAGALPRSDRVARAGMAGRVPGGLPGSWLRGLRAALALVGS